MASEFNISPVWYPLKIIVYTSPKLSTLNLQYGQVNEITGHQRKNSSVYSMYYLIWTSCVLQNFLQEFEELSDLVQLFLGVYS